MTHAEDELALWKRRALRAEGAAFYTLWLHPLWTMPPGPHGGHSRPESAHAITERLRLHFDTTYPDLVTRYTHQRVAVCQLAEHCDCPDNDPDWDADHSESDEHGRWLCSKTFLGYVCQTCQDDEDGGPDFKPEAVAWPCPPIIAVNRGLLEETT